MAGDWSHNATFDEVVELMENEESYVRIFGLPHSESVSSTATTPGLLDTAFLNASTLCLRRDLC
jgi:hypothetical protein